MKRLWGRGHRFMATGLIAILLFSLVSSFGSATNNSNLLITAVYFDTAVSYEPDEAIRIENPTGSSVSVAGWQVCNSGGTCASFPSGASVAAGQTVWLAKQAQAFYNEWTFLPNYEMQESRSDVPNTGGSVPTFANTGNAVYLKDGSGSIIDMVVYGSGTPAAGDPWTGASVPVVTEGQLIHRAFNEADLATTVHFTTDSNSAADWKQGTEWRTAREWRRNQPFLTMPSWSVTGNVTAYTTPDSTYGTLAGLIDGAASTIDIEIYELTLYHLYEKLANALARGVKVRIFEEGNPVAGMTDQAKWIAEDLTKKGAQVMIITSSTGYRRYRFQHAKFGIIDGAKVYVQSENMKANGTPVDTSYGNRGWGVVVNDSNVAAYFQNIFNAEWNDPSPDTVICNPNVADVCDPPSGYVPDQTVPTGSYPAPYASFTASTTSVITPVIAPDHSLLQTVGLRKAFADATKEILAEHMYLHKYWGPTDCNENDCPDLFLKDLIGAARRGVRVRVTLSAAFLDATNPRDNQYTVEMLNNIAATEGLDMEARLENTTESKLEKIHNKGFIIDGRKVLVSSINGSENSPSENREAALLIENEDVAQFYRDVWYWQWYMGKDHAGNVQPVKDPAITEVMYDPSGTESDHEWVELYNPKGTAVDLTGFKLQDNSGSWSFPSGASIPAGGVITVARNGSAFQTKYGFAPTYSGLTISLANTADYVLLVDSRGNNISKVAWGNAKPNWSLSTAEEQTLGRCTPLVDRFSRLDWTVGAATPASTDGCGASSPPPPSGVSHLVITEVFYDTPGDDTKEEWIEIHNPTSSDVTLTSWKLQDNNGSWTFPSGASIAAGAYVTVAKNATGFKNLYGSNPTYSGLSLALGNSGDIARLVDANGAEVDMVAWEGYVTGWTIAAATGESIHRCPVDNDSDSVNDWTVLATETPGAGCP